MTNLVASHTGNPPVEIVYADPPWGFITHQKEYVTPHRTLEDHYETMTMADLKAMPVAMISSKNTVLLMWTTSSHLALAITLGQSWGFEYKSIAFIWVKIVSPRLKRHLKIMQPLVDAGFKVLKSLMGMGFWTRQEAEICLLFTRGKPTRISKGVRQMIFAPRREHSRKPDEAYDRIDALLGDRPRIELFARSSRPGWLSWGNETGKYDAPQ